MAKGNLFLGTAAKSVGDVVMYRREGSQVSRVRVRKIANPKTDAQCKQRAIMSAVVKFYQPLADTLKKSWQGKSVAKSYAAFLKYNSNLGRENTYVIEKGGKCVPFPYKLSEGTLQPLVVQMSASAGMYTIGNVTLGVNQVMLGAFSQAFVDAGYKNGDVLTLIGFVEGDDPASPINNMPVTATIKLDTTDTETSLNNKIVGGFIVQLVGQVLCFSTRTSGTLRAFAAIISRENDGEWLRSSSILNVTADYLASYTTEAYKKACIESYSNSAGDASPMVYLDGDDLSPITSAGGGDDGE